MRAALAVAALFGGVASGAPIGLDPTLVHEFVLAPPRVPTRNPSELLPRKPAVRWRVRVAGGIAHPPSITPDGKIVVAHAQRTLSQYDGAGKLEWTVRLGANAAAASPIPLADGTRLVLSEAAEAASFSGSGALLWIRQLPLAGFEHRPLLAATPDGGLLVADGKRLLRLDGTGSVAYATTTEHEIAALLGEPGSPLLVGTTGQVSRILSDGNVRRIADLGGRVDAAFRVDEDHVLAVVDGRRLVELDVPTNTITVRFSDPNLPLGAALAVNRAGDARVLAGRDLLLAFERDGRERFRAQLPGLLGGAATLPGAGELVLDGDGNAIVVRSLADATLVLADGQGVRIDATACPEPLAPVALTNRSALLACRSGVITRIDETPSPARQ